MQKTNMLEKSIFSSPHDFFKLHSPGPLLSSVILSLHTMDAQMLFMGYNQESSIGLLRFSGVMSQLWKAASKDDPYADYYLLKVYDGIIKLRNELNELIKEKEALLSSFTHSEHLHVPIFASKTPVTKTLWFNTPYGYLATALIAGFDRLMQLMLTLERIGVLVHQSHHALKIEWTMKIGRVFKFVLKWEDLDLTRSKMKGNNDLTQQAIQKMGKIPEDVMSKKIRSPFSPVILTVF
jgi:integrating conjugative element protein (TIGR03761 family)